MKYFISFVLLFFSANMIAQQTKYVDFKTANIHISINPVEGFVSGRVVYTFDILQPLDSIFINSRNLSYKAISMNKKEVDHYTIGNKLWLINDFKPSEENILILDFEGFPKNAMYFVGWNNDARNQIWTQGQGKYTSSWLPSFDDVNEKVEFDLKIQFKKPYQVIANGKFTGLERLDHSDYYVWHYDMQQPMSSYLLALAIGKYDKKTETSQSGIPLEMYYYPEDSAKVEPTYRYTKQMFDFLEEEIGVSYPWQNYKQVPVHDFLYAGMENTSCTIFSDAFMTDEIGFVDKNYVNVNAHELAHQWFGDLVTAKSGEHHWLQEGFATYYALLAEKELFGDDYYYWRLYEYAQELLKQEEAGNSTSLLNPKSSSLTFYKKGAWVLHMLREKVGDKAFKKAIKSYLKKHQFRNVETDDFISEVENASGIKLSEFVENIIVDKNSFNIELVKGTYKVKLYHIKNTNDINCKADSKSKSLKKYLKLDWEESFRNFDSRAKIELLNCLKEDSSVNKIELYETAFQSKDVKLRQAIAQSLTEIPSELKRDYESLLNDKSYKTIEIALYNLWNNFPEDQEKYLEQTKNIMGFNDKNVRTLWLVLAILTDNDEMGDSNDFFQELNSYTSPSYQFEVRQNAFKYLRWIRSCKEECIENLKDASNHHNWRFKQYAKRLLESY